MTLILVKGVLPRHGIIQKGRIMRHWPTCPSDIECGCGC